MLRLLIISSFLFATSCGGDDPPGEEAFDTFDDCYVDHLEESGGDPIVAVKICCLDHPIGDDDANVVCGEDQVSCEAYVDAEVDDPELTADDITTACEDYLVNREL